MAEQNNIVVASALCAPGLGHAQAGGSKKYMQLGKRWVGAKYASSKSPDFEQIRKKWGNYTTEGTFNAVNFFIRKLFFNDLISRSSRSDPSGAHSM